MNAYVLLDPNGLMLASACRSVWRIVPGFEYKSDAHFVVDRYLLLPIFRFLTQGPAGKVYPSSPNPPQLNATGITCLPYSGVWPVTSTAVSGITPGIGGINALRASSPSDPYSPILPPTVTATNITYTPRFGNHRV